MKKRLILSGKGGTGKATVAAAIARCSGARALADCDVDAPNLHLVSGSLPQPQVTDSWEGTRPGWTGKSVWAAANAWSIAASAPFPWQRAGP